MTIWSGETSIRNQNQEPRILMARDFGVWLSKPASYPDFDMYMPLNVLMAGGGVLQRSPR